MRAKEWHNYRCQYMELFCDEDNNAFFSECNRYSVAFGRDKVTGSADISSSSFPMISAFKAAKCYSWGWMIKFPSITRFTSLASHFLHKDCNQLKSESGVLLLGMLLIKQITTLMQYSCLYNVMSHNAMILSGEKSNQVMKGYYNITLNLVTIIKSKQMHAIHY